MRALVAFCLTASIVSATAAVAQTAASTDSSAPTLKVNTRLTLVDVVVTDSKGQPVHGLTQADFTVKEDGKPQPIKNFEEMDGERSAEARLPPNIYTNRTMPGARALNIILFDQVATGISTGLRPHPETLKAAKDASLDYLQTMPEGTQVAIMEMDGSGLHLRQGFTSDRDLLLAAVNAITYQRALEGQWDPPSSPSTPGIPPERPNFLLLCNAMNYQSAQTLNALNQLSMFVSSVPGRKNLVWFTPGVPWLASYQPFSRSQNLVCLTDFTPQLQAVYGRLTAERVALYPTDPRGLIANVVMFTDNDALEEMAKATGGKAHFNNGLGEALRDDITAAADYYALSYVPPLSKYDGKYHTIKVTVDRPGLQLQYRQGYTSLDVNGPLLETEKIHGKPAPPKDAFQTAMSYGAATATQVEFAVRALPSTTPRKQNDPAVIGSPNPELKGKPLARYSFAFDLPRDKITLVQQPDGTLKASFELAIVAYDVQGRRLNSLDQKRSFVLPAEKVPEFLHKPFVVPVEFDLPSGNVSVRAGVLDLPSQQLGAVQIPLRVVTP
jgi:VWFA-related protein